jgi:hypothetical protein
MISIPEASNETANRNQVTLNNILNFNSKISKEFQKLLNDYKVSNFNEIEVTFF